jgi:hypothetical protein
MRFVLTALLFVGGLIFVVYGAVFLVEPASIAPGFGLEPDNPHGWSTLRADMTAFFLLGGGCMMIGAWRRAGDVLLVPALLFGVAFIGRLVSLGIDGSYEDYWFSMAVELAVVVVSIAGHQLLPHHKVGEITS